MIEIEIKSRSENKLSFYWAGMRASVAVGLNVRLLARKVERLAFQQTRAFQDLSVYYTTCAASKVLRCWKELMFPEQIPTLDSVNASWTTETGKHTGSHSFFIAAYVYLCLQTKYMLVFHFVVEFFFLFFFSVNNVYFTIKKNKFHLD